jgi:predicted nucleic acid-binding Zn ribbon protein
MPTYEYKCEKHGIYEAIHSINLKIEFCEECEKEGIKMPVVRLICFGKSTLLTKMNDAESIRERESKSDKDFQERYKKDENFRANIIGESEYNKKVSNAEKTLKNIGGKFGKVFGR